ncbi:uncharacterized protein LOC128881193 [Hylaeus volcanicus]|uniref:uncharacterized protein LOC128881193 n=1 Tax=Hylaeus volcanicus TaxID=313075 RepID=UPI0023B869BC|nr:uncharacterized protein LOC128881193 [Hylaeus volcanicus]
MTAKKTPSTKKRRFVEELHAPARRNFPRRRVIVPGYDDLWQADVVEMRPYARYNRGFHYILTVTDVLMMKASVVEQFSHTLKNDMWKLFTLNGSYKWIDSMQQLISNYNARKHRTIGMRPIDVTPTNASKLLTTTTVYNHVKIAAPARFRVGDTVRVSKFKTIFEKGYTPNWGTEIFTIAEVQKTNPATYLLKDVYGKPIAGGFYEHELQRVADADVYLVKKVLRRKGNKVYVKWLGLNSAHNSWINKDNVL